MLVGMQLKGQRALWNLEESQQELAQLTATAGAAVVGTLTQKLERPTHYYLGEGKLNELKALCYETRCNTVVFDDELSPTQQRNLERELKLKVIDRTALILHIFSMHARTREGMLQVELAQHQYLLPRLVGQWQHLERLGGGIGTRGPGETQLETDRRLIRKRIQNLKERLEEVRKQRAQYRDRRRESNTPVVSLVGYTNAGKSTLFNALSKACVLAEDKLFSTLDPVTRRVMLPSSRPILLTDTVGFLQKLPTTLVAAFRATLEELEEAHLLLHVVDITHTKAAEQAQVVDDTLKSLGLVNKPKLMVYNKADLLVSSEEELQGLSLPMAQDSVEGVLVSSERSWNLDKLLKRIEEELATQREQIGTPLEKSVPAV